MKRKKMTKKEKKLKKKESDHKYYERTKRTRHRKQKNRKNQRTYYWRHRTKILRKKKQTDKKNRAKLKIYMRPYLKKYRATHKCKIKKMQQLHYQHNKKRISKKATKYVRERTKIDLRFKLMRALRSRLWHAINTKQKTGSAISDLGCSVNFLKNYIAAKFTGKMSWSNWGKIWELDHIIALHKFDLTDRKQFLKACNYKNLQPLTVKAHLKKTAKELKELRELRGNW